MKRFLSIILALCMIMTLIPSVFAEDTTTETQEYSGITVKYDFTNFEGAVVFEQNDSIAKVNGDVKNVDYLKSYGFWKYRSRGGKNPTGRGVQVANLTDAPRVMVTARVNWDSTTNAITYANTDWVAFEITVPKAGLYDVTLNNLSYGVKAGTVGVWILPGNTSDTSIAGLLTEGTHLKSFDFIDETNLGKKQYTTDDVTLDNAYYFDAGTYIFVYKVLSGNSNGTDEETGASIVVPDDNADMYLRGITLDGDGAGVENAIPMSMVTSVDNAELKVGSDVATAQMSAAVYMSNLEKVTEGITYTSSDENVATVDANGLITAKAYGVNPVEITASATIDGHTVENSEEITVNADGIEIAYNVGTASYDKASSGFLTALTYDSSNGFYEFVGTSSTSDNGNNIKDGNEEKANNHLKSREKGVQVNSAITAAFEVYIPRGGTYTMEMWNNVATVGGTAEVYLSKADALDLTYKKEQLGTKVGSYYCKDDNAGNNKYPLVKEASIVPNIQIPDAGWYVLSFKGVDGHAYVGDFTLISGTDLDPVAMPAMIKVDSGDIVELNETTNASAIKYLSDGISAVDPVAVTSSEPGVLRVNEDGTITGLSLGTATLSATVTYNDKTENLTREIEVADIEAGQTVSFAADGVGTLYVDDEVQTYTDLSTIELNRGDKVKVVAATKEGETFRGWVRGSADYGRLVSNSTEYEFTAMTHTFLTAVYSDTATEGDVEYYGWNEQYITTLPADAENEPDAPELTGYEFAEWVLGKSDDNIARKVAQYTVLNTEYEVTVPTGVTKTVEGGKYVYDAKVTCTAGSDVYWYRDNVLVDYGTTYSFYIWDNTEIKTSATGKDSAKIMLDKSKNGKFMVEYDAGNEEIVEVGLIFGSSSDITIDNCSEKMNSQRNSAHGQFTASMGSNTFARGYLIYNDNGTYRVIYAD